jgi:prolyl oligopeptidase
MKSAFASPLTRLVFPFLAAAVLSGCASTSSTTATSPAASSSPPPATAASSPTTPNSQPLPPQSPLSPPPLAEPRLVQDNYFGTIVTDPYRYFENVKTDPAVQAWYKGQADYARAMLDRIPGRQALLDRLTELSNSAPTRITDVTEVPGRIFYLQRKAGENQYKLYTRAGWDAPERLLVDPDTLKGPDGAPVAINYFTPSTNGTYVAYGASHGGSEDAAIHLVATATGKDLGLTIDRAQFGGIDWRDDESGFFYNQLKDLPPGAPSTLRYQDSEVRYHHLGDDPANDTLVFGTANPGGATITPAQIPFISTIYGDPRVFVTITDGTRNEYALYVSTLADLDAGHPNWRRLFDFDDLIVSHVVHGDDLYVVTFKNAPRSQLLHTSVTTPDFAKADVVIPPGDAVVETLSPARDAIYVELLDGGIFRMQRLAYTPGATPVEIDLPVKGSIDDIACDIRLDGVAMFLTSWIDAGGYYVFDPASNTTTDTHLQPRGPYDQPADLVAEEVKVPSHDGVLVPMSIIHRKGLKLDGSNPCWLTGYGAYGIVDTPYFSPMLLAWFERGGIYAEAHVRGGGAYGEQWHQAGRKLTKPNTWKDLIACAQWLIDHHYTSTPRLGISGGSAGGITVGRALTERPDLFAAVVAQVGLLNTLRSETDSNGIPNIPEFGTFTDPKDFPALLEMDSYQHIVDGTKYPAVMLTTGMNDPRVPPWEPGKFAARLEQAGAPLVLLRVDYEAGHGIGSTKAQRLAELADTMAFFLWQFGVPAYQPPPLAAPSH